MRYRDNKQAHTYRRTDGQTTKKHNAFGGWHHKKHVCVSRSGPKFIMPWNIHFCMQVRLRNIYVNVIYQGHQVKVMAMGAKRCVCISCLQVVCLRLKGNLAFIISLRPGSYTMLNNSTHRRNTNQQRRLTARVHVTVGSGRPLARHSSCRIPFTSTLTSAAGYTSTVGGPAVAKRARFVQNY